MLSNTEHSANKSLLRNPKTQKRVVVTGVGAVTPLGLDIKSSWSAALEGRSGIDRITRFDTTGFDVTFAGEVKGFNPDLYIEKKEQKKMEPFIQFALASSRMALEMARLSDLRDYGFRAGVIVGVGMGGLGGIEDQHSKLTQRGPGRVSPFFIPMVITNLAAGQISIATGAKGVNYAVSSACASGVHAIGEAVRYIRDGHCDIMLTGGTESTVSPLAIAGFSSMRALSTRNDQPQKASRPWDKDRDGFVLSEGSAIFVIESLENALKRGANILCEITGYGASSDAYHMTSPSADGEGASLAMKMALADASLEPMQINYINAHGTSTPAGDGIEVAAIKNVFGSHAKNLLVSSTKSMTGHALGAAGAIESAFCIMSLVDQIVAPTINLENPDTDCDLDFVANTCRKVQLMHVLNNSFGFGGTNSSLVFSKL